ncbi:MAG: hypothetical protein WED15_01310 [Akkermansiaceae bacterium]
MSLKGFHIVFVTVSTLLFLFMAVWGFFLVPEPTSLTRVLGAIGVGAALVMLVYGVYFYRKISRYHL